MSRCTEAPKRDSTVPPSDGGNKRTQASQRLKTPVVLWLLIPPNATSVTWECFSFLGRI